MREGVDHGALGGVGVGVGAVVRPLGARGRAEVGGGIVVGVRAQRLLRVAGEDVNVAAAHGRADGLLLGLGRLVVVQHDNRLLGLGAARHGQEARSQDH